MKFHFLECTLFIQRLKDSDGVQWSNLIMKNYLPLWKHSSVLPKCLKMHVFPWDKYLLMYRVRQKVHSGYSLDSLYGLSSNQFWMYFYRQKIMTGQHINSQINSINSKSKERSNFHDLLHQCVAEIVISRINSKIQ